MGGAGFSSLAFAVGGAGLPPLASAVGGVLAASTHISYSITGTLLWYSILVPRPYPLQVGYYGVWVSVCVGVMVGGSSVMVMGWGGSSYMERRGMCWCMHTN